MTDRLPIPERVEAALGRFAGWLAALFDVVIRVLSWPDAGEGDEGRLTWP